MAAGKVWLVGAGPGDIGLFTLKGAAVLQQADVVVYDSLVGEGVLAKIPEHARLINVGKRANHHTMVHPVCLQAQTVPACYFQDAAVQNEGTYL